MSDAEEARERARAQVRAAFASAPAGPPRRRCRSCGAEHATARAECPACGKRYDRRLPWLSDRARWALGVAVLGAVALAAALLAPGVRDAKRADQAARARAQAAAVAAERARLIREQRPRRGQARDLRPAADASAAETLAARVRLVGAIEAAILADTRARIAAGELDGPVREVACGPLERTKTARPDHEDLAKRRGRYDCVAVKADVVRDGTVVAAIGHPFVATADFRAFTFVWCKDNKAPGERGEALAEVPLDRACLGAEGAARVGKGYALPED
jgi:hypothetical protein